MSKKTNKCQWCREETNLPESFYAMSPIQPKMEKKILRKQLKSMEKNGGWD